MKKLCTLLLLAALTLGLFGCGTDPEAPTAANKAPKGFLAGFGMADITPLESVPLDSYGDSSNRMSDGIKDYLEGEFYSIQIEGEVSGFKPSSSGHYYFTLKDSTAAISAVLFARSAKNAVACPP